MGDPRFNSIHLDGSGRRDDYRQARERLLNSRGLQTLMAEKQEAGEEDRPDTIIQGPAQGQVEELAFWLQDQENCVYPLKVGVNTAGRSEDNDVVVEDAYVSRRHFAILIHVGKTCELHDTASKNGTYLNGDRISGPTPLKPGDEVRVCGKHYIFRSRQNAIPRSSGTLSAAS